MKRLTLLLRYAFVIASTLRPAHGEPVTADIEFFEKRIRPILVEHCYECHSATSKQLKGGLRADDRAMLLRGGDTGPGITVGKPEASLLIAAMSHRDKSLAMPSKKPKLPDEVVADFERWIRDGAFWPESELTASPAKAGSFDLEHRKRRLAWIWETPRRQIINS